MHSWEMEFSIQYHVTINSQLNDQNSIRYHINAKFMSAILTKFIQLATLAEILEGIFNLKQTVSYFLLFQWIFMFIICESVISNS